MPEDRVRTRLGEVLTLEYGKALPERERDGVGAPVYGSNGIVGHHSQPLVPGPGIVVGRKGTAGSVTWSEEDFFPIDTTYWVMLRDDNAVDLRFMALLLESANLPGICAQTGVPGLNRERAYDLLVDVPGLDDQRRIVDLVGAIDAQIGALDSEDRACITLLAALRTQYFQPLNGDLGLTSVMSNVMSGGTPSRKRPEFYGGHIPWLKSGEVASPWIYRAEESITKEALTGSSAWVVPAGALVVAMYGATAAEVGFLGKPMATNQAVLAMVPNKDRCDGRFAYHWFCHHSPRLKAAASGAAQPNLSKAVILREIGYPDLNVAVQASIGQMLDAALATADVLVQERQALRLVRSATVDALLKGHVEIPASYDALLGEAV